MLKLLFWNKSRVTVGFFSLYDGNIVRTPRKHVCFVLLVNSHKTFVVLYNYSDEIILLIPPPPNSPGTVRDEIKVFAIQTRIRCFRRRVSSWSHRQ